MKKARLITSDVLQVAQSSRNSVVQVFSLAVQSSSDNRVALEMEHAANSFFAPIK